MPSTKEKLYAAAIPTEKVSTPEWRGLKHVHVRKLDGVLLTLAQQLIERYERDRADRKAELNGQMTDAQFMYRLFIIFVCDDNGAPVFVDADLGKVMKLVFVAVERCVNAGLEFNHMTEEAATKMRGKSKPAPRGKRG